LCVGMPLGIFYIIWRKSPGNAIFHLFPGFFLFLATFRRVWACPGIAAYNKEGGQYYERIKRKERG